MWHIYLIRFLREWCGLSICRILIEGIFWDIGIEGLVGYGKHDLTLRWRRWCSPVTVRKIAVDLRCKMITASKKIPGERPKDRGLQERRE